MAEPLDIAIRFRAVGERVIQSLDQQLQKLGATAEAVVKSLGGLGGAAVEAAAAGKNVGVIKSQLDELEKSVEEVEAGIKGVGKATRKVGEGEKSVGAVDRVFGRLDRTVEGAGERLGGFLDGLGSISDLLIAGLGLQEAVDQFGQLDQSYDRLNAAVERNSQLTSGNVGELERQAAALSRVGTLTRSQLIDVQSSYANLGLGVDRIKTLTEAAAEITKETGDPLSDVARDLQSAVLKGGKIELETARRLGVNQSDVQDLDDLFKVLDGFNLRSNANVFSTITTSLKNLLAELGRSLGFLLGPVIEGLSSFVTGLTDALKRFNDVVAQSPVLQAAVGVVGAGFGLAALATVLKQMIGVLARLASSLAVLSPAKLASSSGVGDLVGGAVGAGVAGRAAGRSLGRLTPGEFRELRSSAAEEVFGKQAIRDAAKEMTLANRTTYAAKGVTPFAAATPLSQVAPTSAGISVLLKQADEDTRKRFDDIVATGVAGTIGRAPAERGLRVVGRRVGDAAAGVGGLVDKNFSFRRTASGLSAPFGYLRDAERVSVRAARERGVGGLASSAKRAAYTAAEFIPFTAQRKLATAVGARATIPEALTGGIKNLLKLFSTLAGAVKPLLIFGAKMVVIAGAVTAAFAATYEFLKGFGSKLIETLGLQEQFKTVKQWASDFTNSIGDYWTSFVDGFVSTFQALGEAAGVVVGNILIVVKNFFNDVLQYAVDLINKIPGIDIQGPGYSRGLTYGTKELVNPLDRQAEIEAKRKEDRHAENLRNNSQKKRDEQSESNQTKQEALDQRLRLAQAGFSNGDPSGPNRSVENAQLGLSENKTDNLKGLGLEVQQQQEIAGIYEEKVALAKEELAARQDSLDKQKGQVDGAVLGVLEDGVKQAQEALNNMEAEASGAEVSVLRAADAYAKLAKDIGLAADELRNTTATGVADSIGDEETASKLRDKQELQQVRTQADDLVGVRGISREEADRIVETTEAAQQYRRQIEELARAEKERTDQLDAAETELQARKLSGEDVTRELAGLEQKRLESQKNTAQATLALNDQYAAKLKSLGLSTVALDRQDRGLLQTISALVVAQKELGQATERAAKAKELDAKAGERELAALGAQTELTRAKREAKGYDTDAVVAAERNVQNVEINNSREAISDLSGQLEDPTLEVEQRREIEKAIASETLALEAKLAAQEEYNRSLRDEQRQRDLDNKIIPLQIESADVDEQELTGQISGAEASKRRGNLQIQQLELGKQDVGNQIEEQERLIDSLRRQGESTDAAALKLNQLKLAHQELSNEQERVAQESDLFAQAIAGGVTSALSGLGSELADVAQGSKELSDVFIDMLGRMLDAILNFVTQQAVAQFTAQIIGSAAGAAGAGAGAGAANGGIIGSRERYSEGGHVPGAGGGGDIVPALLTPGEVVVNSAQQADIKSKFGVSLLEYFAGGSRYADRRRMRETRYASGGVAASEMWRPALPSMARQQRQELSQLSDQAVRSVETQTTVINVSNQDDLLRAISDGKGRKVINEIQFSNRAQTRQRLGVPDNG